MSVQRDPPTWAFRAGFGFAVDHSLECRSACGEPEGSEIESASMSKLITLKCYLRRTNLVLEASSVCEVAVS